MLSIAFSLLSGFILSWFGFDNVVITGMKEVFGVDISITSYYFLFGLLGAIHTVFISIRGSLIQGVKEANKNKTKK